MEKDNKKPPLIIQSKFIRGLTLACGFLFTFLAFLGALLPLLPTTPFLILAAACFHRSSPRFYKLIMNNRYFGHYLRDYQSGKGIPLRIKMASIAFLWVSSIVSVFCFVPFLWLKILILAMTIGITVHIFLIRSKKRI
jgi:hypothetical protein